LPEEYVQVWGTALGKNARPQAIEPKVMAEAGLPDFLIQEMTEMMVYACKYGYDGGDSEVQSPAELGVDASKLGAVLQWLRKEDLSQVLGQH
jgi:hypothetical protein